MPILYALLVFCSALVIDLSNARYIQSVNDKHAHRAAAWSLIMYTMGALGFVCLIHISLWLMIPEALGFYVGTMLALKGGK